MAAPSASIIDDFNRASLGSNWTQYDGTDASLAIVSSTLLGRGGGAYTGAYYNVTTYDRPCETYITLVDGIVSTTRYFGLFLLDAPNTSTGNGYKLGVDTGVSPDAMKLYEYNNGVDAEIASYENPMNDGTRWALQLDATHVRLWSDEGAGWVERTQAADTSHSGPFYVVIDIFDVVDEVRLDNLGAGEIGGGGDPPISDAPEVLRVVRSNLRLR